MALPGNIISFTANTFIVNPGYPVTLTWNTSGSSPPTLNGVVVAFDGSKTFYPTVTTKYTLSAYSEAGGTSKSLTVIVSSVPTPTPPAPTPPPPTTPVIICSKGETKCIGNDLYICNASQTGWDLKQKNAPFCIAQNQMPDPLLDFPGWVVALVSRAWEAMLGFVTGGFANLLLSIRNFQANFMVQLTTFIQDPLKSLRGWLDGVYAGIQAIAGEVTKGITNWWNTTSQAVMSWINTSVNGIRTWFNDQIGILQRGWNNVTAGLQTWFNDQIGIFQRGWDTTFGNFADAFTTWRQDIEDWKNSIDSQFNDWWQTKLNDLMDALVEWLAEQVTGYMKDVLNGLNKEFDIMKKEQETKDMTQRMNK